MSLYLPFFSLPLFHTGCSTLPICSITSDNCLSFECCVDLDLTVIQRSVSVALVMDFCNFEISVTFGEWKYDTTLFSYNWGEEEILVVGNAVEFRYFIMGL